MSIDKSLSQYYDVPGTKKIKGQLHKLAYITPKEAKALKKMGGKEVITDSGIPAYPPQGRAEQHGGRSSSRGGNGSHDRGGGQHRAAAAPAPAPAPSGPPGGGDKGMTYKAPEPVRHHGSDTPTQIKEQIVLDKIREKEKEQFERDQDYMDLKVKAPKTWAPPKKTYERGTPFTEGLIETVTPPKYSPTYYQDRSKIGGKTWGERAEAGIKRGSGILGSLGTLAASIFLPMLLPAKAATAYRVAKLGYDIKTGKHDKTLSALGLDKSNLISNIEKAADRRSRPKGMPEHLGERGFRIRDNTPKEDGENVNKTTIAKKVAGGEDVVTKTANQFAGTEVEGQIQSLVQNNLNLALRHYADMYSRIEKGYSPNRQEKDVFKLLEHYLNQAAPKQQGAAYGGRIDKALTGRSRDI